MAQKSLSHLSDIATQETNVANELTPILTFDPSNGTMLRLLNRVSTGEAPGLPMFARLVDNAGNDIATDSRLLLRVVRPTDDAPVSVSVAEDNVAAWNGMTIKEQRNEENIDSVKIELKGERINIRDKDVLRVEVESADVVDWGAGNSELYFAREGVQELPFSG